MKKQSIDKNPAPTTSSEAEIKQKLQHGLPLTPKDHEKISQSPALLEIVRHIRRRIAK